MDIQAAFHCCELRENEWAFQVIAILLIC